MESGISKTIALYTGLNIATNGTITDKKTLQCYENFEMKKILLSLISNLCLNESSVRVFSQQQLILTLFSYVQAIREPLDVSWTIAEYEELQLYAMAILCTVAPLCVAEYMNCQGNTRLLLMLDWCVSSGNV